MRIDPRLLPGGNGQLERVKDTRNKGVQQPAAGNVDHVSSGSAEDTVHLSSTHGDVQTLTAALAKVPEVRAERVAALRQQVHSGNYDPSSEKVAGAMIKEFSDRSGRS